MEKGIALTWSASETWEPAEENLFSASLVSSELADMARDADLRHTAGIKVRICVSFVSGA